VKADGVLTIAGLKPRVWIGTFFENLFQHKVLRIPGVSRCKPKQKRHGNRFSNIQVLDPGEL
jgi:hypothetical protein